MECLSVAKLPDGDKWVYELKLDGFGEIDQGGRRSEKITTSTNLNPLLQRTRNG
jgi:hypothetical protein